MLLSTVIKFYGHVADVSCCLLILFRCSLFLNNLQKANPVCLIALVSYCLIRQSYSGKRLASKTECLSSDSEHCLSLVIR